MKTWHAMVAVTLFSLQAHAEGPQTLVALTRKSGVALARATQVAGEVSAVLQKSGVPVKGAPFDATSCKAKKPCLVEVGRKQSVSTMVLVEVGAAVDSGLLRVEAISVEEDGRRLSLAENEGPLDTLVAATESRLTGVVSPALLRGMGLPVKPPVAVTPPVAATPVIPAKVEPSVAQRPVAAVPPTAAVPPAIAIQKPVDPAAPEGAPFWSTSRVIGGAVAGAGVATLLAAGVFGASALSSNKVALDACPAGQPCSKPEAFTAWSAAAGAQNTGLLLAGIGGAALIGGGVLFLTNPGGANSASAPSATVSLVPTAGGGAAYVTGRF